MRCRPAKIARKLGTRAVAIALAVIALPTFATADSSAAAGDSSQSSDHESAAC
jgi:hypothetical protein